MRIWVCQNALRCCITVQLGYNVTEGITLLLTLYQSEAVYEFQNYDFNEGEL
jgi:hypothetical protein